LNWICDKFSTDLDKGRKRNGVVIENGLDAFFGANCLPGLSLPVNAEKRGAYPPIHCMHGWAAFMASWYSIFKR
jgi:hypothetical protein